MRRKILKTVNEKSGTYGTVIKYLACMLLESQNEKEREQDRKDISGSNGQKLLKFDDKHTIFIRNKKLS